MLQALAFLCLGLLPRFGLGVGDNQVHDEHRALRISLHPGADRVIKYRHAHNPCVQLLDLRVINNARLPEQSFNTRKRTLLIDRHTIDTIRPPLCDQRVGCLDCL